MPDLSIGTKLLLRTREFLALLGAAVLAVFVIAGCAYSPSGLPSSTTVTPAATPVVLPAAVQPTEPPTRDPAGLLQEAIQRQANVRTVRGLIALDIRGEGNSPGEPVTTTIEFEYAKPNVRLTGKQHPSAPTRVVMILTDEAAYVKAENMWLATTPGTRPTEVKLLGFDALPSFLQTAAKPRLVGQREAGGVLCDVISFDLPANKLQELADLAAFKRAARDGVTVDSYEAEIALGAEDRLIREMSLVVRGHDKMGSKLPFVERVTVGLWDFGAPDISVEAPPQAELLDLGKLLPPNATPASQ